MATLPEMLGGLFIGILVTYVVFGVNQIQFFAFFNLSQHCPIGQKLAIGFLWAVEVLRLGSFTHATYFYLVVHPGNPDVNLIWTLQIQIFMHVIIASSTKTLYALRVWKLAPTNKRFLPVVLYFLLAIDFSIGAVLSYGIFTVVRFQDLPHFHRQWAIYYSLSASFLTDASIVGSMIYVFALCNTGFVWRKSGVSELTAYALNTGLPSGFFSIATLIAFARHPWGSAFLALAMLLSEAYLALTLAMINAHCYFSSFNKATALAFQIPTIDTIRLLAEQGVPPKGEASSPQATIDKMNEVGLPLFEAHRTAVTPEPHITRVEVVVQKEEHSCVI